MIWITSVMSIGHMQWKNDRRDIQVVSDFMLALKAVGLISNAEWWGISMNLFEMEMKLYHKVFGVFDED